MTESFESELDRLAALQELDRQLTEKQNQLASLTGAVREFETRRDAHRLKIRALEIERDQLETQRRDLEGRVEDESNKIRDSRMRMNRVRNEREQLALQHEVNMAQDATKQFEDVLITVLERLEQLTSELGEAAGQLGVMEKATEEGIAERDDETKRLTDEIAQDRSHRDGIAGALDTGLRSRYEQIFTARNGAAVVEVSGGTCLGCHMQVPPQLFNELQKFRDVRQCPNCHRILFWKPGEE